MAIFNSKINLNTLLSYQANKQLKKFKSMKSILKKVIIIMLKVIRNNPLPMDTNKISQIVMRIQLANLSLLISKAKRNTCHSLTSLFKNSTKSTSKNKNLYHYTNHSMKEASTKNKKLTHRQPQPLQKLSKLRNLYLKIAIRGSVSSPNSNKFRISETSRKKNTSLSARTKESR